MVPQCPGLRQRVNAETGNWDEFALYASCERFNGGYVELTGPKISDNGARMWYITSDNTKGCIRFCKEFGFSGSGTCRTTTSGGNMWEYVSGNSRWEMESDTRCTKCECYP